MGPYRRAALAVFALLLAGAGVACSFLLDTSQNQCDSSTDCVSRGGVFATMQCVDQVCVPNDAGGPDVVTDGGTEAEAGPWSCLGSVVFPQPDASTVNVVLPLVDLQTTKPVTTVTALLCAKIDPACSSPLASAQPDSMGLLHFTGLTPPFDGFVLITPVLPDGGAPDAGDAAPPPAIYVPSLVFFNPPLVRNTVYTVTVMVTTTALGTIAFAEQTALDPNLGAVFMETVDCNGNAAAGVSVTIDSQASGDAGTKGFYFKGGLPSLTTSSTDSTGYAGYVNAPLGTRTVTGTLEATGQKIGTATVLAAKSMISYTTLAPSP